MTPEQLALARPLIAVKESSTYQGSVVNATSVKRMVIYAGNHRLTDIPDDVMASIKTLLINSYNGATTAASQELTLL